MFLIRDFNTLLILLIHSAFEHHPMNVHEQYIIPTVANILFYLKFEDILLICINVLSNGANHSLFIPSIKCGMYGVMKSFKKTPMPKGLNAFVPRLGFND